MHAIATVALAASAAAVATRPWRSWPERALDQALRECPHENLIGAAVIVTCRRLRCGQPPVQQPVEAVAVAETAERELVGAGVEP